MVSSFRLSDDEVVAVARGPMTAELGEVVGRIDLRRPGCCELDERSLVDAFLLGEPEVKVRDRESGFEVLNVRQPDETWITTSSGPPG